jgi:bromodomain-containing factor 1
MSQTIRNLKKRKDTAIFINPVDPIALGIPTYFDIVKHPMDISTIEKKMAQKEYSTIAEVKADFDLMFANCFLFNGQTSAVALMCKSVQTGFEREMLKLPKVAKPADKKKRSLVL